MARIVVIGAGVSGLSAAEWLTDKHDVTVVEARDRVGGNVWSDHVEGHVLEQSANGFLDSEPAMDRLVKRVGLESALVRAQDGARYVVVNGKMTEIPTSPLKFFFSPILTLRGKLRLFLEPFMSRGPEDETIADFVRRRIGQEAVDRLVGPMVSGIYAGNADELSLPACFPKMKAMERDHGSLVRAMLARRSSPQAAAAGPAGKLTTFVKGLSQLPLTIGERLGDRLQLETSVTRLERNDAAWRVHTSKGEIDADGVVLACPGFAQSELLTPVDAELGGLLSDIPYSPIAVVITVLPRAGWTPPEGFGVLVPKVENLRILGTLFTSSIFAGHAPKDTVVLRTMIGGAGSDVQDRSEEWLLATAREENTKLLGEMPEPVFTRVYRYGRGIPQYVFGHPARVAGIRRREALLPGLFLTGNHFLGIGVKDCARDGELIAKRVDEALA